MSADTKPGLMSAERLAEYQRRIAPCIDGTAQCLPIYSWGDVAELLAHIDAQAAELAAAERMLCEGLGLPVDRSGKITDLVGEVLGRLCPEEQPAERGMSVRAARRRARADELAAAAEALLANPGPASTEMLRDAAAAYRRAFESPAAIRSE